VNEPRRRLLAAILNNAPVNGESDSRVGVTRESSRVTNRNACRERKRDVAVAKVMQADRFASGAVHPCCVARNAYGTKHVSP
jgi:hypothetical protein